MLSLKRTRPTEGGSSRGTSAAAAAEDDRPAPRPHVGAELIVVLLVTLGLAGAGAYLASRSESLGVDARSAVITACLVMLAAGTDNIRDVVAFPKNNRGEDLMMNSPSPAEPRQLRELGLQITRKP